MRFAFDSKTLNDRKSVAKNYQNMINDLATEATTVHSRFPFAVVAFIVVIPAPCLVEPQNSALIGTLERLGGGSVSTNRIRSPRRWRSWCGIRQPARCVPTGRRRTRASASSGSQSRSTRVYRSRYKGLPPHADVGEEAEGAFDEEPGAS